jgi:hypothetical protein
MTGREPQCNKGRQAVPDEGTELNHFSNATNNSACIFQAPSFFFHCAL